MRTFHDSYHGFPESMLFDLWEDPHEQTTWRELGPMW